MPYPSSTLYPQSSGLYPGDATGLVQTVVTGAATSITTTTATLNGTINPAGAGITYIFAWGHDGYRYISDVFDAGSGSSPVSVHLDLTGLTSGHFYQYKLVGFPSIGGEIPGDEEYFYTVLGVNDPVFPGLIHEAGRGQ